MSSPLAASGRSCAPPLRAGSLAEGEEPDLGCSTPHLAVDLPVVTLLDADSVIRAELRRDLAQHLLLGCDGEVHAGSFGSPNSRSPTMLRWT
jgi:hypothetical protein